MSGRVHLVVGYAGTGKDTLYRIVQSKPVISEVEFRGYWWRVYAFPQTKKPTFKHPIRVAFADALKEEVVKQLGLPNKTGEGVIWPQYERQKNTLQIPNAEGKLLTLRQHYIESGQKKKLEDPEHWCKVALSPFIGQDACKEIFVTDARFPLEVKYAQTHFAETPSYRVFRAKVPIAPPVPVEDPEHSLDSFQTDYLLVPTETDFYVAIKLFPQYAGYECRWFMGFGEK